ncbi:MAG: anaerobic sulfatase maturase [Solirubrobacterales bacterium]
MQPFTLLVKPSGSDCNVDCTYCFYKSRAAEIGSGRQRMSDEVLDKLMKDYLGLRLPMSGFAWQGGEPTLMGLDFFKRAVDLQKRYGVTGQEVGNSLQTNAILLNDAEWCRFLKENKFLVGVSIDGPRELHDHYRLDLGGHGTWDRVMAAIGRMKEVGVEYNTLTLVNRLTADHPDEIFDFLVDLGARYLQFIPCVEVNPQDGTVAEFSVTPKQYGDFLCRLFDRWMAFGPDKLSIRDFDAILSFYIVGRSTICTFDRQCSQYIVVEHQGDVFPCDFFVEPKWRLGNILETPIERLAACANKKAFARCKGDLANKCLVCRYLAVCRGGCLKDRLETGGRRPEASAVSSLQPTAFNRESYYCESYRQFFDYAMPRLLQVAAQIRVGALARPSELA